jgi:hypothetical protein
MHLHPEFVVSSLSKPCINCKQKKVKKKTIPKFHLKLNGIVPTNHSKFNLKLNGKMSLGWSEDLIGIRSRTNIVSAQSYCVIIFVFTKKGELHVHFL